MYRSLEQLADEGQLVYSMEKEVVREQIHAQIIDAAYAARIGRQIFKPIQQKAGHSLKFTLETANSIAFNKVAETAEIPIDREAYTQVEITPEKYGALPSMSTEIREDANWDLLRRNLVRCGTMAGLKEDSLVIAAMADSTYGFNAVESHRVTTTGSELDIVDILGAIKYPEEDNYYPNLMVIHPTQKYELNQIDTFVEADKLGNRSAFEKGFCGRIFGLDVIVSPTCTENYAYVLDTRHAGVIVIRRPLTTKVFETPSRDTISIAVTFREAAKVLLAKAGADIVVS